MKTTKKQFELFKREFTKMQIALQVNGYITYFEHVDCQKKYNQHCIACIEIDNNEKNATVCFDLIMDQTLTNEEIVSTAKHEAIHLFLSQLKYLALHRFVTEDEIERIDESMTVVLEKLLA